MKMTKRFAALFICFAVMTVGIFMFASCGDCEHEWGEWTVTKESTCYSSGIQTRVCKLDSAHTETKSLATTAHNFANYVSDNNTTCTTAGTETAYCVNKGCTATDTRITEPANQHSFTKYVSVPATCTKDAYEISYCDYEGCPSTNIINVKSGTALGHRFNEERACTSCNFVQPLLSTWKLKDTVTALLYQLDADSCELVITGSGEMPDFDVTSIPWKSESSKIVSVKISDKITAIGSYNFYGLDKATSINVPQKITAIGKNAFMGSGITSFNVPATVTTLGDGVFTNCDALETIKFVGGGNISLIPAKIFSGCSALKTITLPEGITSIEAGAFYNAKALTKIVIPSAVNKIQDEAFKSCVALESITFEDGSNLTYIGSNAFNGCSALVGITIPEFVSYIGESAFYSCSALASVDFITTANLRFIGAKVFDSCKALSSYYYEDDTAFYLGTADHPNAFLIKGKNDVETAVVSDETVLIASSAFSVSTSVIEITVPFIGISKYSDEYTFSHIFKTVPSTLKTINVSQSVNLMDYAFKDCSKVTDINFNSGISSIGVGVFDGCSKLNLTEYDNAKYIAIGSNPYAVLVTASSGNIATCKIHKDTAIIAPGAFSECTKLSAITVEDGNSTYRSVYNSIIDVSSKTLIIGTSNTVIPNDGSVIAIAPGAFKNCTALDEISIPEGITSIGNFAFAGCTSLKTIVIPNSVKEIGLGTFNKCTSLNTITLPFIGSGAEDDENTNFGYIFADKLGASNSVVAKSLKTVKIQNTDKIAAEAFKDCSNIESIKMPSNISFIGESAFANCKKLVAVYISNIEDWCKVTFENLDSNPLTYAHNLSVYSSKDGVYKKITTLDIPDGVTSISYAAFSGLSSLTAVSIPASVTFIGDEAFAGCSALVKVSIPALGKDSSLKLGQFFGIDSETGKYALPASLKELVITGGTEISAEMFKDCATVESVTIASTVNYIGNAAFEGCTALKAVYITDLAKWSSTTFANINANPLTYAHNLYINNVLAEDIVITGATTTINNAAFSGCTSLKSVTVEKGVVTIADSAFINCSNLAKVTLPNTVTKIGAQAFASCSELRNITLSAAIESIEEFTFASCYNLQTISLPASVKNIDPNAFVGCNSLYEISVNNGNTTYCSLDGIVYKLADSSIVYIPLALRGDINLLDGLNKIDAGLFVNYPYVYSINVPNSVKSIEANAFAGFTNLKKLSVPFVGASSNENETNVSLAYIFGTVPATLTSVTITGDANIADKAFADCENIQSVFILGNTESIGAKAFNNCENLLTLVLTEKATKIGNDAFFGCKKLDSVYYYGTAEDWNAIEIGENNASLTASRILYYSEEAPETIGTHWYYNESGKPTVW